MLGGLPLALLGLRIERRLWPYVGITISYIGLYSVLPHKEVSQSERCSCRSQGCNSSGLLALLSTLPECIRPM